MEYVKAEHDGRVTVITIDRREKLNALNRQVLEELKQALLSLNGDNRALVITGAGDRAFVSGADIQAMREMDPAGAKAFAELGHAAMTLLENHPAPVIAAINGYALGGGCEIALACDIRIAAENAVLGLPEVTLGLLPGIGGTQRLPRLVGPGLAKEMIFSGRRLTAEEARQMGLVNRIVPRGEALSAAKQLATEIAANGPVAVRHAKAALNMSLSAGLAGGLQYEVDEFALLFATEDAREGMGAFIERRKADFQGR